MQVRRNARIEILPLSTGCLGACTYCKTKHARGQLGSYELDALVERAATAAADPLVRTLPYMRTAWHLQNSMLAIRAPGGQS